MSGPTAAAAYADSAVERVRDDPAGRLTLLRQMANRPDAAKSPLPSCFSPPIRAAS